MFINNLPLYKLILEKQLSEHNVQSEKLIYLHFESFNAESLFIVQSFCERIGIDKTIWHLKIKIVYLIMNIRI